MAALKELATSFDGEVAPLLVEVEGQQLKLSGSAETQFAAWRGLLGRTFAVETGLPGDPNALTPPPRPHPPAEALHGCARHRPPRRQGLERPSRPEWPRSAHRLRPRAHAPGAGGRAHRRRRLPRRHEPTAARWRAARPRGRHLRARGASLRPAARDTPRSGRTPTPAGCARSRWRRRRPRAGRGGTEAEALGRHRQQAEAAEGREEWRAALAEHDAALRLKPHVAFALEGRERAVQRAELDERVEGYLKRADRLGTEAIAREASPRGPRLERQVAALDRALALARTPVPVRLLSDGRTEVVVLRVGRLDAFREKALELRPGSYVVVGSRRGCRDARRTLVVEPGRSPEPLFVRCDEAL